jgi:dynein heavy chain
MLVGEGGAGRHSLTKLACFIAKYTSHQISTNKNYRLREFRENIKEWSQNVALKDTPAVLIFSDNQITE